MKIFLDQIGKRYQRYWVFRHLTQEIPSGIKLALLGNNGSGKSTLLRILAGMQTATEGTISHEIETQTIANSELFRWLSFCAPGMDLPEELSLHEFFQFHFSFKRPIHGFNTQSIIQETGLTAFAHKPIADYSSGMKQRAKLAQAIFTDTPLLLLDEPCTNLDEQGVQQYLQWLHQYGQDKTILVASNDPREYQFCTQQIRVEAYKPE